MIEVVIAMAVLVAGILGTLGILDAARSTAATAQRTSAADAIAQRELETMRALPYASLYGCSVPSSSSDPNDGRQWVSGSNLLVQEDYRRTSGQVLTGVPASGEPFWVGTCTTTAGVDPGPASFTSGNVRGRIYRFVTAEGAPCASNLAVNLSAGATTATGIDSAAGTIGLSLTTGLSSTISQRVSLFCQSGSTEAKRLTVAVTLDGTQTGGAGPHRPIYISTLVADPAAGSISF